MSPAKPSFNLPTDTQLRAAVQADIASSGLGMDEYATSKGISRGGLYKFLRKHRAASLEFARKLLAG